MLVDLNSTRSSYVIDILDQPGALQRSLAGYRTSPRLMRFAEELKKGLYKRVVLTGMGSSYFALHPLHLRLIERHVTALMVETSELIHYMPEMLEPESLVIAVSQSGQSAEIVRLLDLTRNRVPVIAVTNHESSPLALHSTVTVMIQAGPESSVSCKTYVASLQALEWLGTVLLGGDLDSTAQELKQADAAVREYLNSWEQHLEELAGLLAATRQIFITGRGASLAAAGTGGLILKESAHFPAEGMSCAAFRHGPLEMLNSRVLVLVFAGDSRSSGMNRRLVNDIRSAGGMALLVDVAVEQAAFCLPLVPTPLRPIVEILPVQMVSLALAARNGHEAGRFEFASKVTITE